MDKQDRKRQVLNIILRTHIDEVEPVGSNYISKIIGLSSATIRNIMSDLEEDGYLYQPHTSAGRVPTERAYRDYVNSLIQVRNDYLDQIRTIRREFIDKYKKYSEAVERISYVMSKMTDHTSFVVYPEDHIYVDGTHCMVEKPEFSDIEKLKKVIAVMDEKEQLLENLKDYMDSGPLKIHIGHENSIAGFEDCSIITASYKVKGDLVGGVGIIGPMRMEYRKVLPVIRYFAGYLSEMIEHS